MKKALISIITLFLIVGCTTVGSKTTKTTYNLLEEAKIDDYSVTLKSYEELDSIDNQSPMNGIYVKYIFSIKNTSKTTKTIDEENFSYLENNDVIKLINQINLSIKLEPNQEKEYIVIYDLQKEEEYNILFYSKIATNNILFLTN